ncbi:hypothetical protein [Streptomyces sp. SBT349]|uniref:hypothetical protein n=1 Tax=Streptomyces sp. SBT349 TaxID=1580539 RepID=UPI00066C7CA8|nr:hypothetical protein [Streptomyces sp. SBT349]
MLTPETFFRCALPLALPDAVVVGQSLYARPTQGTLLRLRIDLVCGGLPAEWDALRLNVIHPNKGRVDEALLFFSHHGTSAGHLALNVHQRELSKALENYVAFWFDTGAASGEQP